MIQTEEFNNIFYNELKSAVLKLEAEHNKSKNLNHRGNRGTYRERLLDEILKQFLPKRYGIASGESFDCKGNRSKQLDIAIYDDMFSISFPYGESKLIPFESMYGCIEVKSKLDKKTMFESLENIASLKQLYREKPDGCQILPNRAIDIKGIKWDNAGFTTPFGVVFAYDSVDPKTALKYFHKVRPLQPQYLPDMIVLYKKQTILMRIKYFENDKCYVTTNNTYQGFVEVPCDEDTLPIFISYILCRINDTYLKITDVTNILNQLVDKGLMVNCTKSVVKFSFEHQSED